MLVLTIVLLLLVAVVSFFYLSYNEEGSMTFNWLDQTGVFPLAWVPYVIGFLILILVAAWLLAFVFSIPKRLRRSGELRSMSKSRDSLDRGLVEIHSGKFEVGESTLTSYLEGTPADAAKYLTAAKAALSRGADSQAEQYLKKAGDVSTEAGDAVRLTQADMFLQRNEFKDAETLLTSLHTNRPRNPHIMLQLAKALEGTGDAKKLSDLTRTMRSKSSIPDETIAGFEKTAWTKMLSSADDADLINTYELLPKESKRDEDVVATYASRLIGKGDNERAMNTLQHAINSEWSDKLVEVYGRVKLDDPARQLEQANSWLSKQPKSAALSMAIGRLSKQKQLWGKAKENLVKAAQLDLTPEVCDELGDVLTSMGNSTAANDCYQSAAKLALGRAPVGALRDLDKLAEGLGS